PETWCKAFCDGFDAKATALALIERGLLLPGDGSKTSRPVRISGRATRAYVLPVAAWTEDARPSAPTIFALACRPCFLPDFLKTTNRGYGLTTLILLQKT